MTHDPQRQALPGAPRPGNAPDADPAGRDPWEPITEAIVGGQVSRWQDVTAGALRQFVDLRRPDGSVWRAYERHLVLPQETRDVVRTVHEATAILALAAGAIAASDSARIARGSGWIGDIKGGRGRYDEHQQED